MAHRRKLKKPTSSWTEFFNDQAKWLSQFDPVVAIAVVEKSLINGYTGLFEPPKSAQKSLQSQHKHWFDLESDRDLERIRKEIDEARD